MPGELPPIPEACSEPCQLSKMKCFTKMLNGFQPLSIFAKRSILDVWQGSEYVCAFTFKEFLF